ncbi:MAG: MATE family efflux transporter [Spirochaetes bacterium]|nr:MATE family efflux transporter [Spirochaetota bacterium]
MSHKANLTWEPVPKTIIKLTLPMMLGMIGMVIFNLVDTFFIGKLGTINLAAMSFTLPVVMLQGSIAMGLGVGASAVISRVIGQGEPKKVQRITTDSLILSLIIVAIFVTIGLLTMDPLFFAMGARGETLILVKQYMFIWYLGVLFVVIPMVGNNAIRAAGNTLIPSIIMLFAICINIILDPCLIFGLGPFPALGIRGAALATVIARATTLIFSLGFLGKKFNMLSFQFSSLQIMLDSWKKVLFIGIPAALTQVIIPLSVGIITRIVSAYGDSAVAALGVGSRIEMFALSPIMALGAVMVPFTGQNLGAGRIERIREGISFSFLFSIVLGFFTFLILAAFGKKIGAIFNSDPDVIRYIALYLFIVAIGYGFQGTIMVSASIFNALNKPFSSMAINTFRMVIYIFIALIGSALFGLPGVFSGASISVIITGIIAWFWLNSVTYPRKLILKKDN